MKQYAVLPSFGGRPVASHNVIFNKGHLTAGLLDGPRPRGRVVLGVAHQRSVLGDQMVPRPAAWILRKTRAVAVCKIGYNYMLYII